MKTIVRGTVGGQLEAIFEIVSAKCITFSTLLAIIFIASACSSLEKARTATDIMIANKNRISLNALVQAEIERQRVRKLRCHSPFLNPSSISGAAFHPNLGRAWVDELLRDCPEYGAFIAELVLRRAEEAGIGTLKGVQGRPE